MPAQTTLNANPFRLLGATLRDDRQRIVTLAEERMLEIAPDLCAKARSDLLNPRSRIGAEVSWLPGVAPRRAEQLIERVAADPHAVAEEGGVPSLARANLLAASLEASVGTEVQHDLPRRIVELAQVAGAVEPGQVLRDINEDRAIARFPLVPSEEFVAEELTARTRYFRTVLRNALDRLPPRQLVRAITQVVSTATEGGVRHAPVLIDDLVDLYEVEAQAFLAAEAENIKKLVAAVRAQAANGEVVVAPLIAKLADVARNWDEVAQPVQVGLKARGLEHEMSRQIGTMIRGLAVDLFNEHAMLTQARRLTDLLRGVFAELPEFAERLDEDADALDEIEASRSASKGKRAEWAREITYRAEIGLVLKNILSISPEGVAWKGRTFPLETITRIRWGATRHSTNGIPTGTTYTVAFGDRNTEVVVEPKQEVVFEAFVERLWKAVGVRILLDTLRDLKAGKDWWIDNVRIRDDGITLHRHKFWSREPVHVPWMSIRIWSEAGMLNIASKDDARINSALSYIHAENAHVLDRMLRAALQRPGLRRLSELLT